MREVEKGQQQQQQGERHVRQPTSFDASFWCGADISSKRSREEKFILIDSYGCFIADVYTL